MKKMKLEIRIFTELDGHHQEELEDKIKEAVSDFGVEGEITSSTGNSMSILTIPNTLD